MKFLISKEALIVNIFLKTAIKLKENNLLKEVLKYQFSEQWRERRNKTAPLIKSQRLMRTLPPGCGRCSKIKTICNVCNLSWTSCHLKIHPAYWWIPLMSNNYDWSLSLWYRKQISALKREPRGSLYFNSVWAWRWILSLKDILICLRR